MKAFRADCGHDIPELPAGHVGGTGYATFPDTGETCCYPCANDRERAALQRAQAYFAYLSSDGRRLTTWTDGLLADVTSVHSAPVGFGHDTTRYYFKATDLDGCKWYGTSPGPGMYARMRRAKQA